MESTNTTVEGLKSISILHYAMMGGLGFFILVTLFLNQTSGGGVMGEDSLISPTVDLAVIGGFCLMGLMMSRFLSQKLLDQASPEVRADERNAMGQYRSAKIIRFALLEGPGLMATVFYLLTGNSFLLLIALFMLAMLFMAKPSVEEFAAFRG